VELREYLSMLAEQLANELRPILKIKQVTDSPELLGAYTEAAVRNLALRVVHPMRICRGAILDYPMPDTLKQIDIIIWAPFPVPAVFETQGFGLVPRGSAFGVLEVKRSNYGTVDTELEEFTKSAVNLVAEPRGAIADYGTNLGMGVVCLLTSKPSRRLQTLIDEKKAVAIFDTTGPEPTVRTTDVLVLTNFLYYVTWRYHMQNALPGYQQVLTEAAPTSTAPP
jgi:hypothetical protein